MADVQLNFIGDAAGTLGNLKAIREQLMGVATDSSKATEQMRGIFQGAANSADNYSVDLANTIKKEKELVITNEQLIKKMAELEAKFKTGQSTAEIDKLVQKIKQLEDQLKKLKGAPPTHPVPGVPKNTDEVNKLNQALDTMRARLQNLKAGTSEWKSLSSEIQAAEIAMQGMAVGTEETSDKLESGRKKLQAYRVTLQNLAMAGLENTQVYKDLRKEAGDLDDTIRDVNEEIKSMGSDTSGIDKFIRGVQLGTAAAGAYEGVVALTGQRNEALEKTLTRLNAVMTISNSLQTIMAELKRKDSVLTAAQVGLQKLWTIAVGETTGATRILRTVMATVGIGIAIAAIVILVQKISEWTDATAKQAAAQRNLNTYLETTLELQEGSLEAIANTTERRIAELEAAGASAQQIREAEIKGIQDQLTQAEKLRDQQQANGEQALANLQAIQEGRLKGSAEFIEETEKTAKTYSKIQDDVFKLENKLRIANLNNIRDTNQEIDSFNEEIAEKRKAAAEKEDQERKQRLENILSLEKELARARLELMKDGRTKDIATENTSSQQAITDLQRARDERGRSLKEIALYNQLIEQEQINHVARITAINLKYYKDAQEAFTEANEQINDIFLSDTDRELKQAEDKYAALFKTIDEVRKKNLELAGTGLVDPAEVEQLNQAEIDLKKKLEYEKLKIKAEAADRQLLADQELAILSLDALQRGAEKEEEFTKKKEALKLAIEQEFAQRRMKNLISTLGLQDKITDETLKKLFDQQNVAGAAKANVDILEFIGVNIDDKEAKKKLLELLKKLQEEGKEKVKSREAFSLQKFLFGDSITDKEFQDMASSFTNLFDQIAAAREAAVDREIDAIDRRLDKLDEEVEKQEDIVDQQLELSKEGVANNLDSERQKLDDLKQQQALEIKSREDAMKKLEQIRKQEAAARSAAILASGVEQATNLATAASAIFKAHAGIPFAGVVLAIAAVASMIGTFLSVKNTLKAATAPQSFAKGDQLDLYDALKGRSSHANKGVGVYDNRTGQEVAQLEGDEKLFVINKGSSGKYKAVLDAINRDEMAGMSKSQLSRLLKPIGIHLDAEVSNKVVHAGHQAHATRDEGFSALADLKSLGYLSEINDNIKTIADNSESSTEHGSNYRVERYGSYKRIIKKS